MANVKRKKNVVKPPKRKKKALGKGLNALIPDVKSSEPATKDYFQCDINDIRPNRYQPRHRFSETELKELSRSIKTQGIIQPLLVQKGDGDYELIAGERRLRAAKIAGLDTVPVVIKQIADADLLEMSIIENIQREDLNPMEEAEAYHHLMTEFDLTQDQVAHRVGKSRSAVANFLRLRQLPDPIKNDIINGDLSMGHARALLGTDTKAQQISVWKAVMAKGMSVRETEKLIRKLKAEKDKTPGTLPDSNTAYLSSLAEDLARHFGTKVMIKRRGKKGKVEIEFYSDDDLDRLLNLLKP
jgi:ParB family chromosome partitioning protein